MDTHRFSAVCNTCWHHRSHVVGTTALSLLLLVSLGSGTASAQNARGAGAAKGGNKAERMDKHLAERLAADGDDVLQHVIITMKPGAKRRLVGELRGQGHRVDKDFGLIEAFASQISGRRLRVLLDDADVASISDDADVTPDGIASSVAGTAQGTPYSGMPWRPLARAFSSTEWRRRPLRMRASARRPLAGVSRSVEAG